VALPVLRSYGLTAFWFVYTSVCQGTIEQLEIYRQFRTTNFNSIDDFYAAFFAAVGASERSDAFERAMAGFVPREYLTAYPFYSDMDRRFRFVRDEILGPEKYALVMKAMIARSGMDVQAAARGLWMGPSELRSLHEAGHVLGLHSHTHPTRMERLPVEAQRTQYRENFDYLAELTGEKPQAMSHPCNSYSRDTLKILRELGIVLGFRANMQPAARSELEYPREDHANLMRAIAA
jgi:peptidoglycan/xylan/chitin deacetylase (PgdA/CDA1 family)